MWTALALGAGLALLPLLVYGNGDLIISDCEDAALWRGGAPETELVRSGAGAVRWAPSENVSLVKPDIPHDWTSGNCLRLWLHSAQATGSRVWLILQSEDPAREGMDYYLLTIRVDWEGWREIVAPLDEIGRVRNPVGWHDINSFHLHAAWDPAVVPNPADAFVIDDIRVTTIAGPGEGPRTTDEEFFAALDLSRAGLEEVRAAVEAGDLERAKEAFREYFLARRHPRYMDNWWERPPVPAARPNTSAADDTVNHIYTFDRGRYDLGPDIDWASNQRDEGEAATIEWNAALNRHFFFRSLGAAYWGTLEDRYAEKLVEMKLDWIRKSPLLMLSSGVRPYHYAWQTLNTACRAGDTWIDSLWRTADAPAWTPDALVTVVKSLAEHARHLVRHPATRNWLTAQSKAVATVGMLFPEFREAADWRRIGIERLYGQMHTEVYPDGMQDELALGYNLWVVSNFAHILDLANLNGYGEEVPVDYKARLERMYNYLLYARAPDGRVPGLNDSWYSGVERYLEKAVEYFPHREDFLWGATGGREGRRPEVTSHAFDYSGNYVLRSGWEEDARFLFLNAGPFGSAHQHEDGLTFFMHAHGREWITEGGNYMYDASRWRRYVLSTRAHNTVRVDGQDQNRRRLRDTWVLPLPHEPLGNPWVSGEDFDYVAGVYDSGYGPEGAVNVTHRRDILFVKPDYWIIVDTLEPAGEAVHEYETIFHINADEARVEGLRVSSEMDGKRLDIIGAGPGLSVEVVKGVEEEPVQGWVSGPWRPVPTALYRNRAAGPVRNVYVMHPAPGRRMIPGVEVLHAPGAQAVALRIDLPDGEAHYFAQRGLDAPPGPVTLGPITTDADVCLVRVSREGKVSGVFALGGTEVSVDGVEAG